ncbi:hypothetical protein [Haloechinothrix sp. LS1_15]|uniref:hypothetical protein n=1 Tax=Haloechinothrix sp. LS1_15 TaxID=2652248 RepID=UPI002948AD79|nr:hypothetical protein [Haloechinothrix sp. LS1_15]MDV6014773.1 hypothetical protein [Haloechinothrix sp. LS1_15]
MLQQLNDPEEIDLGILDPHVGDTGDSNDAGGDQPYQPDEIGRHPSDPAGVPPAQGHLDDACAQGGHTRSDGNRSAQAWECGSPASPDGGSWSSDDPLVEEAANAIEASHPGHVTGVNVPMRGSDGKLVTDMDIRTRNAIVQVKSGTARGIVGQMERTQGSTADPVIAYIPEAKHGTVRELQRRGYLVTQSEEELVEILRP